MTVPVPLTDIEDACRSNEATGVTGGGWSAWQDLANPDEDRNHYIKGGGWAVAQSITEDDARYIATADPPTVLALCEALRIAVEGLGRIGEPSCPEMRLSPVERLETARAALAAVRELVDLGGDDG